MEAFWEALRSGELLTSERVLAVARAAVILAVGLLAARLLGGTAARLAAPRFGAQGAMVGRRATFYAVAALAAVSALHELGFHLSVLLGAAGVLTVALGFASQTSASNLISGLFLVAERPFVVGDTIEVESVVGEVLSIDMLSVKIRTFDNRFVRVPNETIIKSRVTTLTHFPIRRMDLKIGVGHREDLGRVREILAAAAARTPEVLEEPEPLFLFLGFGTSALEIQFSVWTAQDQHFRTKSQFLMLVKEELERHGVEIPYPQVAVSTGSGTEPLPVKVVQEPEPR
jgi:small-conductance mechanosensitive channel